MGQPMCSAGLRWLKLNKYQSVPIARTSIGRSASREAWPLMGPATSGDSSRPGGSAAVMRRGGWGKTVGKKDCCIWGGEGEGEGEGGRAL